MAKKKVKLSSEQILYEPKVENVYPICHSDWGRIKRMINSLRAPNRIYGFLSSSCAGLFISSLIAIIDIYNRENVAVWFEITMLCILIISIILVLVFVLLDKDVKNVNSDVCKDILGEMEEIENKFKAPVIDAESNDSSPILK